MARGNKAKKAKIGNKSSKELNVNSNSTTVVPNTTQQNDSVLKRTRSKSAETTIAVALDAITQQQAKSPRSKKSKHSVEPHLPPRRVIVANIHRNQTPEKIEGVPDQSHSNMDEYSNAIEQVVTTVDPPIRGNIDNVHFIQELNNFDNVADNELGDGIDVDISPSDEERFPESAESDIDDDGTEQRGLNRNMAPPSTVSDESEVFLNRREFLEKDPEVQKMIDEAVKKRLQEAAAKDTGGKKNVASAMVNLPHIKSPSDTTVYAPALIHTPLVGPTSINARQNVNSTPRKIVYVDNTDGRDRTTNGMSGDHQANFAELTANSQSEQQKLLNDQIAHFVENIRLEAAPATARGATGGSDADQPQPLTSGLNAPQPGPQTVNQDQLDQAKTIANDLVLQAEKFKASIAPLPGTYNAQQSQVNFVSVDDQFFHISCHIEQSLKEKIERGEFVDLERLLAKPNQQGGSQRLELFNKDDNTYFAPAERSNKINGIKCWDKAFRVYAAIYCRANPQRSAEIWQYIHVINTAASAYIWDNVSQYDFTFRQLMSTYPQRSWGNIYQQMWSLSMGELLHRGNFSQSYSNNSATSQNGSNSGGNSAVSAKERRKKYCWKFNKNRSHDSDCKFEHKCKFCDATTHGFHNCPKRSRKANEQ